MRFKRNKLPEELAKTGSVFFKSDSDVYFISHERTVITSFRA